MGLVRIPRTLRFIPFLIAVCFACLPAYAQYSGGSGTADDPYRIATAADLIALGETPDDYDKHFILTADIDLDPSFSGRNVFGKALIAFDFQRTDFTGILDVKNHTISHLTIRGGRCLGLFGDNNVVVYTSSCCPRGRKKEV